MDTLAEDVDGLPSFFAAKSHIPEGVSSLMGELEDNGLLGDEEDDENLEMNMETFGAASMAEIDLNETKENDMMMSLEEIEANFNQGTTPQTRESTHQQHRPPQPLNHVMPPPAMGYGPPPGMPLPPMAYASAVMPPPGMQIPVGVDPATGRTIYAPQSQMTPPPMQQPTVPLPPPSSQQQQQSHRQSPARPPMQAKQYHNSDHRHAQHSEDRRSQNGEFGSVRVLSGKGGKGGGKGGKFPFVVLPPSVPKRGKLMSGGEVATVLHAHMRSLEVIDPYREDFYYHNYMLKEKRKQEEMANASVLGAKCNSLNNQTIKKAAEDASIPLPVWQDTKEKLTAKKEELWGKFAENTKDWEEKNKVFGHSQKSNPHRPKALLNLSSSSSSDESKKAKNSQGNDDDDDEDEEIFMTSSSDTPQGLPFSDRVWGARKSIENAKVALLAIDEMRRLLSRPDMDELHRTKTTLLLSENFNSLQEALGFSSINQSSKNIISNVVLLESIIQQDKGKKLLSRVFKLLPSQACLILPLALKTVYTEFPLKDIEFKTSQQKLFLKNKIECEDLLLTACLNIINAPPVIVDPTTMVSKSLVSFNAIKACMEGIMSPHVANKTLGCTLLSKQRVELVQAVMKKGEALINEETEANKTYWKSLVKAFYDLASSSKTV